MKSFRFLHAVICNVYLHQILLSNFASALLAEPPASLLRDILASCHFFQGNMHQDNAFKNEAQQCLQSRKKGDDLHASLVGPLSSSLSSGVLSSCIVPPWAGVQTRQQAASCIILHIACLVSLPRGLYWVVSKSLAWTTAARSSPLEALRKRARRGRKERTSCFA